ncbi:MAG: SMC-Scp complex subunit ScpB [Deltaproteobacteria bacterium]|nr:SMC-Scp complex subunit ScpB [Deltaproteobacteria bacterium]
MSEKREAPQSEPLAEVQAHAIPEITPPSDDEASAVLDAAEGDAALDTLVDQAPAVGEGHEAPERLKSIIESLLFASEKPLSARRLQELSGERDAEKVSAAIEWLRADYADRGVVLHEVAGGFQFRTSPMNAFWVQQLMQGKPVRLSRAQLEALAIVAYRQPITRAEIEEIRGVDSGGALKTLLDRGLVRVIGKKEEPGRPLLYGTTRDFLEFFQLKDLRELPTLREFHELSAESMEKVRQLDETRLKDKTASDSLPGGSEPSDDTAPIT